MPSRDGQPLPPWQPALGSASAQTSLLQLAMLPQFVPAAAPAPAAADGDAVQVGAAGAMPDWAVGSVPEAEAQAAADTTGDAAAAPGQLAASATAAAGAAADAAAAPVHTAAADAALTLGPGASLQAGEPISPRSAGARNSSLYGRGYQLLKVSPHDSGPCRSAPDDSPFAQHMSNRAVINEALLTGHGVCGRKGAGPGARWHRGAHCGGARRRPLRRVQRRGTAGAGRYVFIMFSSLRRLVGCPVLVGVVLLMMCAFVTKHSAMHLRRAQSFNFQRVVHSSP